MFTENEKESLTIAIFEYLADTRKIAQGKDMIDKMAAWNRISVCKELISIGQKLNIESFIKYKPFWIPISEQDNGV